MPNAKTCIFFTVNHPAFISRISSKYPHLKRLRLVPALVCVGLAGCGSQGLEETSKLKADAQDYTEWCVAWDIDCTPKPASSEPKTSFNAKHWDALTSLSSELLKSAVRFNVSRGDVDSPQLAAGFQSLGIGAELDGLKVKLDNAQWQSFGIEAGTLVSRSLAEGSLKAANGLGSKSGTSLSVRIGQGGAVQIAGLTLSSRAGDLSADLTQLSLGATESLNLKLDDHVVSNVPFSYLEDSFTSAFGIENIPSQPKDFTRQQLLSAMYPLLSWINKPQRTATLSRSFFTLAEAKLKPILAQEESGPALLALLSAVDSFDFSATAGKSVVRVGQTNGSKLKCNMNNGESTVMFDREFGLKRYWPVDGGIGLEFFGIKATAKLALGIPLTLKRIEIRPNKITILDIPIIGKVDLDLDTFVKEDKETTVACAK